MKFIYWKTGTTSGSCGSYWGTRTSRSAPDAWYDPATVKMGYEVSFNRYSYKPTDLRRPEAICADLVAVERGTEGLLAEILGGGGR